MHVVCSPRRRDSPRLCLAVDRGKVGSFGSGRTAGYAIGEGRTSPWPEAIAGIRERAESQAGPPRGKKHGLARDGRPTSSARGHGTGDEVVQHLEVCALAPPHKTKVCRPVPARGRPYPVVV